MKSNITKMHGKQHTKIVNLLVIVQNKLKKNLPDCLKQKNNMEIFSCILRLETLKGTPLKVPSFQPLGLIMLTLKYSCMTAGEIARGGGTQSSRRRICRSATLSSDWPCIEIESSELFAFTIRKTNGIRSRRT